MKQKYSDAQYEELRAENAILKGVLSVVSPPEKEARTIAWDAAVPEGFYTMMTIVSITTMPIEIGKGLTLESTTKMRDAQGGLIVSPPIRLIAKDRYAMTEFIQDLLRDNLKAFREDQERIWTTKNEKDSPKNDPLPTNK